MKLDELKEKTVQSAERAIWRTKMVGRRAVIRVQNGIQWVIENPEKATALAAGGAALLGGANKVIRGVHRNVTVRRELYDKKHRVYDHSTNMYLYTKRPLKKADYDRIYAERRRTGKRVGEILSDMDLLRR